MAIPTHTLTVLELPEVRRRAAGLTSFSRGRELALALAPASDRETVAARLQRTTEARRLLDLDDRVALDGASDVRESVELASRGYRLEPPALLQVQALLGAARRARRQVGKHRDELPGLWSIVQPVDPPGHLEALIERTLDQDGRVVDGASRTLGSLRTRLRRQQARLARLMQRIAVGARARPLLREPIVTERNGRLVVPVKQDRRKDFDGIVHDTSTTGATVFMEPMAAVEPNNQVRELAAAERHEVERILRELSGQVGEARDAIVGSVEGLAALDLALALGRYANRLDAEAPDVADSDGFRLAGARHPLLEDPVVPIDVELNMGASAGARALVITGPNTGGKTVALKTIGLLHLMAACGMHLPVKPGSSVAVYEHIYADIGDEQSIEQSLSTFSSHLRNLVTMVESAAPHTLMLADEVGAGTDPTEGSALGHAIVERILEAGATAVVTTHHPELKTFAYEHPLARNASVEFDVESLQPTFRLVMGVPGKSNALEIAARLGLDPAVVESARARLGAGYADVERVIGEMHADRAATDQARRDAEADARDSAALREELDARLAAISNERDTLLRDARRQARGLLRQAQRALVDATRAAGASDQTGRARRSVERAAKRLDQPAPAAPDLPERPMVAVAIGDTVHIEGYGSPGEVVEVEDGEVEVAIGSIRTRVPREAIREATRPPTRGRARRRHARPTGAPVEISLRGQRAAAVGELVDAGLDRALLAGADRLVIVHGKGTSTLRRAVRDHLDRHPAVESLADAPLNEGGAGVTVVRLADG